MLSVLLHLCKTSGIHRAEPPHEDRDSRQTVLREVLATHRRLNRDDVVLAEDAAERRHHKFNEVRVILRRGGPVRQLDSRLGRASTDRSGFGFPFDPLDQPLARLGRVASHRELQPARVADDVVLGPAVNRSDRDDGWLERVVLTADQ